MTPQRMLEIADSISRVKDRYFYEPTTAFLDATGVWRVFRSPGGMTPLPFEPTHFQKLPKPPESALNGKIIHGLSKTPEYMAWTVAAAKEDE